jgi:endonuclease G
MFSPEVAREIREQPDIEQLSDQAQRQLERVVGKADFLPVWFLQRGADLRHTVAKIRARSAAGMEIGGTGFLVGPGLLLTNAHVLDWSDQNGPPLAAIAPHSTALFDYEERYDGTLGASVTFALDPDTLLLSSPWNLLDYVLVALKPLSVDSQARISDYGYNRLTAELGKIAPGEPVFIIQHPLGELKQVVINDNRIVERDEASSYLVYEADTNAGSSGAPVFNRQWEVVGLHHSAQIARDTTGAILDVDGGQWKPERGMGKVKFLNLNEGVRISKILHHLSNTLQANDAGTPPPDFQVLSTEGTQLLQELLQTKQAQAPTALVRPVPVSTSTPKAPAAPRFARPE